MIENTAAAYTLGCKVNQYDTEKLLKQLAAKGFIVVDFNEMADLYIINTCTVTQAGEGKSHQMIRRARRKNPRATVAVCGCAARHSKTAAISSGADFVFDARDADTFFKRLNEKICFTESDQPAAAEVLSPRHRTRAYLKIQDGCDRYCAYCVVPYVRGPVKSRLPEELSAEASAYVKLGFKEIVLTGIHIASYGKDLTGDGFLGVALPGLIDLIAAPGGPERVRLSSIEPVAVDDAFLHAVEKHPAVCDHFHPSLQSGCDRTLLRMNRRYATAGYAEAARRIREIRPDAALTTDIIVGFPGETDADFEESLRFAADMDFARMHVFEYSARAGTAATAFLDQIPADVKKTRGKRMRALADELSRNFLIAHIGNIMPVLFETKNNGSLEGHTANYMKVRIKNNLYEPLLNETADVQLTAVMAGGVMAGALV